MHRDTQAEEHYYAVRDYLTLVHPFWATQSDITRDTGLGGAEMRSLCQAHKSTFVSSQNGYKLAIFATREDVRKCVTDLLGRAEKMSARARALSVWLL